VTGRIGIDDVARVVYGGRYPAKAVVGETVPATATVCEGRDAVAATRARCDLNIAMNCSVVTKRP
jgi:starch synthase (maltosyl-transferring)